MPNLDDRSGEVTWEKNQKITSSASGGTVKKNKKKKEKREKKEKKEEKKKKKNEKKNEKKEKNHPLPQ